MIYYNDVIIDITTFIQIAMAWILNNIMIDYVSTLTDLTSLAADIVCAQLHEIFNLEIGYHMHVQGKIPAWA